MSVLEDHGDCVRIQCDFCGTKFWSDACTEDNCIWVEEKRCNYPQCPECKNIFNESLESKE